MEYLTDHRNYTGSQLIHYGIVGVAADVLTEAVKKFEDGGTAMYRETGSPFLFSITETWIDSKVRQHYNCEYTFAVYCLTDKKKLVLLNEETFELDTKPDQDYFIHYLTDLLYGILQNEKHLQTIKACTVEHFYRKPEREKEAESLTAENSKA